MHWPTQDDISQMRRHVNSRENKDREALSADSRKWIRTAWENRLDYDITWFGIPIIQTPEDIVLMQELIYKLQPDVIVETGVAHGGSLIFYASMLEILGRGNVIGVDIEIRRHNRDAIQAHPLFRRIELIEGDSTAAAILDRVRAGIPPGAKTLVCLDSNHSREHVAKELAAYHGLVTPGSYLVVFDTVMPQLTGLAGADDKWEKDNPMEAVKEFVRTHGDFEIDKDFNRLFVTHCPDGFLKKKTAGK